MIFLKHFMNSKFFEMCRSNEFVPSSLIKVLNTSIFASVLTLFILPEFPLFKLSIVPCATTLGVISLKCSLANRIAHLA